MTTETDIANMALGAVGARSTIQNFSDGSKEANVCSLFFDPCKRAILRGVFWNFARKQANLMLLADASLGQLVPQPFTFKYAYPADCVRFRSIVPLYLTTQPQMLIPGTPAAPSYRGPVVKWLINSDTDALGNPIRTILTYQQQAVGIYTFNAPVAVWDDLFIEAMVGALAKRICAPVSGNRKMMEEAVAAGKAALDDARVQNGNENVETKNHVPDWMRVRGYVSDYAYADQFIWGEDPGLMTQID